MLGWTVTEAVNTWDNHGFIEHDVATYRLIDENFISISIPKLDRMCYLDVVAINAYAYGTTTIKVSSDQHPNQLYVRYYE